MPSKKAGKINEQGWEEIGRRHYGIRFVGGGVSGGVVVYVLETVELKQMIGDVLHLRSEIQHADTIRPRDLLEKNYYDLYRLIDSAAHAASWVQQSLSENEELKNRAKARGTKP